MGPAKAQAIVEFRTKQGPFSKKEDIKKVSGIGDATYSKIESLITVK
ncbi:MAG TPA: helix-hairpin-helix domain-containing protein [Bacillota bacterium]|nr:helix-hairpin-helix domain-containing protein [Bacillota bacterium]